MAVVNVDAEPRPTTKPEPLGSFPLILLFTTCTLCALFLLWRRASELRTVVAHQLTTWNSAEGRIRLSTDDGPSAREFLDDDYDEDNERLGDEEPLAVTAERLRKAVSSGDTLVEHADEPSIVFEADTADPPPPPPKS
ncbi:hypothetical protein K466DRAFT_582166 [Polyporus arcularius HHB13444]|uniref:Uncharacterized protein n=1 Tax=Polyporus arcularius HHB13444 TaxID=1314778 RepID=A0A5C3PRN5_9APHY|nr:hypothetical protein K466DRAFT_582166 [Polyporus arcularius HHB13444]